MQLLKFESAIIVEKIVYLIMNIIANLYLFLNLSQHN